MAHLLATDPEGTALLRDWVCRLVFSVVLGYNDAHAKNIALLHTAAGTRLAPVYDVVPNLFSRDMIDEGFRLALPVNGSVDHREVSAASLVAEVQSWQLTSHSTAAGIVSGAITDATQAVRETRPPSGVSGGLVDKLTWTADRLDAGDVIGMSPWQRGGSLHMSVRPATAANRQGRGPSRSEP